MRAVCECARACASDAEDRVIRAKASRAMEIVLACGKTCSERVPQAMRHVCGLLGRVAESARSGASEREGKRAAKALLNLTIDKRQKVRKAAVEALRDVVR